VGGGGGGVGEFCMKIAVFHNFMDNIGGAEMVALTLARELDADIYTTNINAGHIAAMGFGDVIPRIKSLGTIPAMAPFRHQLALWKFRRLNLGRQYDRYIIAGDWAMSAAVNHHPNLWYVHSPLNELWQWKDFVRNEVIPQWWKRPIFDVWVWFNRMLTRSYARHVDTWACNSTNTKGRIRQYYRQEATIINPPVNTANYHHEPSRGYWLSVNRLLKHKRIDIQIEAFAGMPDKKLIIVGSYEKGVTQFESYKDYIESIKTDNIEIRNWVEDEELRTLYEGCRGFITTARDEDFGMTAVEAMAAGKPVVAVREGGYKESIIDGVTGILINECSPAALIDAIKKIEEKPEEAYTQPCLDCAKMFDTKVFIEKIRQLLKI
jgi:glycosyltransferase involved in cell wall biosynthesis